MKYTREELLDICENAFVQESDWSNRDSCNSQAKLGTAYAFLRCGCEYQVMTKETEDDGCGCITNDRTIWLRFFVQDFMAFEYGDGPNEWEDIFYLPTPQRLEKKTGDWY